MDELSSILRSVRLGSAILSRAELSAPWGVRTRGAPMAIFHTVVEGRCVLVLEGDAPPVVLDRGDVVVLTRGDPHVMCDDPATPAEALAGLPHRRSEGLVPVLEHGGGGAPTRLLCGTFRLQHDAADALLALLPPVMHVPAQEGGTPTSAGAWMIATLRLLEDELRRGGPGADMMIERLADVLFAEVVRRHVVSSAERTRGWVAALHDGGIGRALALIHTQPATEWSAGALAARVGMSRTRFFERFTELVGDPPARYVARSRVSAAADLMVRRDVSTAELASLVGYASEKAFTKVFKRYLGESPSEYRRRLRDPRQGHAAA